MGEGASAGDQGGTEMQSDVSDTAGTMETAERRQRGSVERANGGSFLGRSFFPLLALVLILGTMIWGPWVSLALVIAFEAIVMRVL